MRRVKVMRPPQDVLDQIEEGIQDDQTMRKVIGFARKLIRRRSLAVGDAVEDQAEQLIQDAISDSASGRRTWRPERVALSTHLCGVIKDRVLKSMSRRRSIREVPFPRTAEDEKLPPRQSDEALLIDRDLWRKVREHLFQVAEEKEDNELQLVLMAYDDHCVKRADVAEATGLTVEKVTNAGKRLDRVLDQLPPELLRVVKNRLGAKGDENE